MRVFVKKLQGPECAIEVSVLLEQMIILFCSL